MNPIIHCLGICAKYIILNVKVFLVYLIKRQGFLDSDKITTIVFTHNLGGGTESYVRKNFYKDNILIVRLLSYRNDSFFLLENMNQQKVIRKGKIFGFLDTLNINAIIVNSLCAYRRPNDILKYVSNKSSKCEITYLIHDFHCICKNGMLIYKNKFCKYNCNSCSFNKKTINKWRKMWGTFLYCIDDIICFSNSSKEIICSFYSSVNSKIKVIPHSMDYCVFEQIITDTTFQNIAIVGNCSSVAKGKLIIKKLVPVIKKAKKRKLYIIGKTPFLLHRDSTYIKYIGPYDLKVLPKILISGKIGVIVFTSILPETFSYAISEFMKLGLYIVSLNLGAQGEKLQKYDKAVFVQDLEPETILEGVEKCFI